MLILLTLWLLWGFDEIRVGGGRGFGVRGGEGGLWSGVGS